jgi:hypothetical protein
LKTDPSFQRGVTSSSAASVVVDDVVVDDDVVDDVVVVVEVKRPESVAASIRFPPRTTVE